MSKTPTSKSSGTPRTREQLMSPTARKIADEAIKDGEARIKRIEAAELGIGPDTVAPDPNKKAPKTKGKASPGKGAKGKAAKEPKAKAPTTAKPSTIPKEKKVSLLSAAAIVLAATKEPMRAPQILEAITKRDLWSSPNGKTPEQTLYAALIREIAAKGDKARFKKHDKGVFVATAHAKTK